MVSASCNCGRNVSALSCTSFSRELNISAVLSKACNRSFTLIGGHSKISDTFLFLFSNKMIVIGAAIHKLLVRIANSEDPEQTASSEAV